MTRMWVKPEPRSPCDHGPSDHGRCKNDAFALSATLVGGYVIHRAFTGFSKYLKNLTH